MKRYLIASKTAARVCGGVDGAWLAELWHGFCFSRSTLTVTPVDDLLFSVGQGEPLPVPPEADYALHVTEAGACVSARTREGLLRGIMDLLRAVQISDDGDLFWQTETRCGAFDVKVRMVHLCVFPETPFAYLKKLIRFCGVLQYTHVVLEFWGMFPFRCLKELAWQNAYTPRQVRELVEEIRAFGMSPVPMFNHLGHASGCRMKSGKHVVLDQDPALAPLFSPDGWTWRINSPRVRDLLRKVREELLEAFGPCDYFHLGVDEAYLYGVDASLAEDLVAFLNDVCAHLLRYGCRPILWGDLFLSHEVLGTVRGEYTCNCKDPKIAEIVLGKLDKHAVFADWQYYTGGTDPVFRSAEFFASKGFDVLCCPWENQSVRKNVDTARKNGFGVMETTWHTLANGWTAVYAAAEWCRKDPDPICFDGHFHGGYAAALLRRVSGPVDRYEDAGWASDQISTGLVH